MKYFLDSKKNVILLLFCAIPLLLHAQQSIQQQQDSLRKVIASAEGEKKLDAYWDLCSILFSQSKQIDTILKYTDLYEKEARLQKDTTNEGLAKKCIMLVLSNHAQYEKIIQRGHNDLIFFQKHKFYVAYSEVYECVIMSYFYSGQRVKALEEAQIFYEQAKQIQKPSVLQASLHVIGQLYQKSKRFDEAENYFRLCIAEADKTEQILPTKFLAYFGLVDVILLQHKTAEAEKTLTKWESDLKMFEKQVQKTDAILWKNFYQMNLKLYSEKKDYDKGAHYCQLLESLNPSEAELSSIYYHHTMMAMEFKEYNKVLEYTDKGLEIVRKKHDVQAIAVYKRCKAEALCYLGKAAESVALYKQVLVLTDSITNLDFNAKLDELRTQYEVDKLTAQKEANRNYMLLAIGGCLLLLVALIIYIVYSFRLKAKNRSLYQQIQERLLSEKEAGEALIKIPEEKLSREMKLFRQVQQYLLHEQRFTDGGINRKSLADTMGSNEVYLSDAIREGAGCTLSEYLAQLRLQYALELLQTQPELTLEAVAVDSGHGSYSPFFRAFTKTYGMNPSEYRKLSIAKNEK